MIHKGLTPERWFTYSLFEQLANVGMDIERTIEWRDKGDQEYSIKAFERALELLDLTIADPKNTRGARKELLRVRECLIDYFMYDNEYLFSSEYWQQYFYEFALASAIVRGR